MENSNINDLWSQSNNLANSHFGNIENDLRQRYSKKSLIEITKIKKLFWLELFLHSIYFLMILLWVFNRPAIGIGLGFAIDFVQLFIGTFIGYFFYYKYYKILNDKLNHVPTLNLNDSLHEYLKILKDYRKRSTKMSIALICFFTLFSSIMGFADPNESIVETILVNAFGFGFAYVVIYEYYDYMYKPAETEIEILIRQLEEE